MIYVGIDNGLSGGVAAIDGDGRIVSLSEMPKTPNGKGFELDVDGLRILLSKYLPSTVAIELPTKHSPGVLALCSTWCCYGGIRAVLAMEGVRTHEITSPLTWQKLFWTKPKMPKGRKFDTKAAALKVAKQLWPHQDWRKNDRCKVPHDGLVDAALIAEYARRVGV